METKNDTLPLRPYQAVIWGPEPDSIGIRTVYFATDGFDAKRQAMEEHGEHRLFSIWNEEDAEKCRS